ncbi:excinuclease ABC subunit UvrC [Desulfosediminicola flagellatus]|uniref:excinuclease ABC subunit UvrC n=1 Tax=Desulfosediminicola flagellatus TaxID=2569541 RepID=UPI0010AC8C0D|nr:excinuclease ABC subunit UvrC [Desulfosediminicola flagellatus]
MFPQDFLSSVPHSPGVYLMLGPKSVVLYVGKAKDLFKRLSSYARYKGAEYNKTRIMLSQVAKVDTILTHTEKEALILEASLIKKHKPKYNIILRDDKNYPFIKVTSQEEWPRVHMARRRKKDGARYFGPYSSSSAMWSTLKLIASLFPLRKCKGGELKQRKRPCLNHQMGKCLAPCAGHADHALYTQHVNSVIMILEGRNKDLIRRLSEQMQEAATSLDFELAATLRDQINALNRTLEKQVVSSENATDQDVFGFSRKGTAVAISLLFIREGLLTGSRNFFLEDPYGEDQVILSQVLTQYYDQDSYLPKEILLPFEPEDLELIADSLSDLRGARLSLLVPQRGDKVQLITMATANSDQVFSEREKKKKGWESLAKTIQHKLHLQKSPERIECLDISNISGKQAVGSLVCFEKGEPAKPKFRHYKIRTIDGPNDYGMMREVLNRRLSRGIEEEDLPDLFVVDGGKGQLSMALSVAEELGIRDSIDWIGIAKEKQEEGEKLYKPGRKNPILLPSHNPVLLYIMRIRDESHRFGVTFHRKLRNKSTFHSELDQIPGIGKERKTRLLKHFGSLKNVRAASIEALTEVDGVGGEMAKGIFEHFNTPV